MTDLIGTPLTIFAAIILYIICTTLITRYAISGGKTTKEIIDSNKLKAKKAKDFLNKYPEANIKTGRNFALAFGFIFAFASSIYAFSIIGERQVYEIDNTMLIDSAAIIQIQPPIYTEKKVIVKEVPPPPPPKTHPEPIIKKVKDDLPIIDEPVIEKIPIIDDPIIKDPVIEEDPKELDPFFVVESMPRFRGCEGLDEEEANTCTRNKFQDFLNKTNYSQEAIDNGISGTVYVSFVIDENGEVADVEILKSDDKIFNNDVIKRLKKLPKFSSPGKQRGKKVKVKYQTTIKFITE